MYLIKHTSLRRSSHSFVGLNFSTIKTVRDHKLCTIAVQRKPVYQICCVPTHQLLCEIPLAAH